MYLDLALIKRIRPILPLLALVAFGALFLTWAPEQIGGFDREAIDQLVSDAGYKGPVIIVLLMTVAVVASPIPSAPIALAAGAAYGHYAGAIYVAIGSELGAMIAFLIARYLGRDSLVKLFGSKLDHGLLGSQNALTIIIFTSRLLPFISFDAMSYAAGLSGIQLWRFLLATLAGIIPASFVLAHFGSEAMSGNFGLAEWLALGLGFLTATPLLVIALRRKRYGHSLSS
ncbi:VTT domain-containing protein (plasmid) [Aliiroseovarius crassostreae]|uniref:TVP38/TMEM64 family membrane protein n=1 Tax=Aliiroseovarius crassostreae TaxID=154981 RepID=A0A9Q9LWM0_9RHOB|nr:VTT domain-containing protein [Aliiroseovarius crassostreae]UWP97066.1 VTT domain-containing protein [Aliiroseovarius crassostreae]